MARLGRVVTILSLALLFAAGADLHAARKYVEMPDNFGETGWAVQHWEKAVDYLKYVTDDDTRKELRSVPGRQRAEAWDSFWKGLDPVEGTSSNEMRKAYFERVRHANETFPTLLQEGWQTDMGEVYIRLGEPRQVDRYNMRASGNDIQVWSYWSPYAIDLVFYDETGLGDFYLLNYGSMVDRVYYR